MTATVERRRPGRLRSRLSSSILVKVLAGMVAALVLSSAVTGLLAARLAQAALSSQARQLAASHLRILEQAYGQRQRGLLADLRTLAENIDVGALTDPERHDELVGQLSRASIDYQLDLVEVVDGRMPSTLPMAAVGDIARASAADGPGPNAFGSASRLLATAHGGYVQAVPVAIRETPFYLIGGFGFDDGFAFDLRRQLGDVDDVVLVASGKVVGSTLDRPVATAPAITGGRLPSSPTSAKIGQHHSLVAYATVGVPTDPAHRGALGIVQANPGGALNRSLSRQRWITTVALTLLAAGLAWLLFRYLMAPLVELSRTAGLVAVGDPTASFSARGTDEVGALASSLEAMRVQLAHRLSVIERQAAELQESSRRAVAAQDEERRRIARDLHDGVQQQLVVLRMRLGLATEAPPAGPAAPLEYLGEDLDRVIGQLRDVSHDLYPSILVDRGLTAAFHSHASRLPVSTKLTSDPDPLPRLPPAIESGAYFTLCEALTNALKHSGASEVTISIRLSGDSLTVSVDDNGRGFVAGEEARGGLRHMEDRARSFGGEFHIKSHPAGGTRVSASFMVER